MKLHHLRPAQGAVRDRRRVGRGKAAGQGKTAGRGTKGLLARHNPKLGFEGGQMPIQRRTPHLKGFTNVNRVEFAVVNVGRLGEVFQSGAAVGPEELRAHGLIRKGLPVKVLGQGELATALTVRAHAVSAAARGKIEHAGGTVEIISL
jgi:large subunit ribosomal protein L15